MNELKRNYQEWCDAHDPDPLLIGWDDPRYKGTVLLWGHEMRVLLCVIRETTPFYAWAEGMVQRLDRALRRLRRDHD